MIQQLQTPLPANEELRKRLYAGEVLLVSGLAAIPRMVALTLAVVREEFGEDFRRALPVEDFLSRLAAARKRVVAEPQFNQVMLDALAELGFAAGDIAVDPMRLRGVMHDGHVNPKAAPAYSAHRDCWYANPQEQINLWLPLHDVGTDATFAFFHQFFDRPVENNSADFDYGAFKSAAGFGSTQGGAVAVYPSVPSGRLDPKDAVPFAAKSGEVLLFSASQLHQTTFNTSGLTRFSLDFRVVSLSDHATACGAPNVDNCSIGSALDDYVRPGA